MCERRCLTDWKDLQVSRRIICLFFALVAVALEPDGLAEPAKEAPVSSTSVQPFWPHHGAQGNYHRNQLQEILQEVSQIPTQIRDFLWNCLIS